MFKKKKNIFSFLKVSVAFLLLIFFLLQKTPEIKAETTDSQSNNSYQQTYDVCYAGCVAWDFYWNNNPIWNYIQSNCTMDGKDAAKTLIKFTVNAIRSEVEVGPLIQALWCTTLIKQTLVPILDKCSQTCELNQWSYAADLTVAQKLNFSGPGIFYYPAKKDDPVHFSRDKLVVFVNNSGWIYVPNFKVEVYQAQSRSRDCEVDEEDWQLLDKYEIDELQPVSARRALSTNDVETMPGEHHHTILWSAPADVCTKIKVVVDPDDRIPELNENNNVAILTINNLPTAPNYQITDLNYELIEDALDEIKLRMTVKNNGEEVGRPDITIRDCYKEKTLRASKRHVQIEGKSATTLEFEIKNLFWPDEDKPFLNRHLCVDVEDENSHTSRGINVLIFSGEISGKVMNIRGEPVKQSKVLLKEADGSIYATTTTDEHGYYRFTGIKKQGDFIIVVKDDEDTLEAKLQVKLSLDNPREPIQEGLYLPGKNLVLVENLATLSFKCSDKSYGFRLNGEYFSYEGVGYQLPETLQAIVPGNYQLILNKPGSGVRVFNLSFSPGEKKTVDCSFSSLKFYQDDKGIHFKPKLNHLWTFKLPSNYNLKSAVISPDGSTIFLAISNPRLGSNNSAKQKANSSYKLLIFNQKGKKLAEANIPGKLAVNPVHLSPNYDGSLVLVDNNLLFNRNGQLLKQRSLNTDVSDRGEGRGSLSWDGSLICTSLGLFSSAFDPLYTGVWSPELDKKHTFCRFGQWSSFAPDTTILAGCKSGDGLCWLNFFTGVETRISNSSFQPRSGAFSIDKTKILASGSREGKSEILYFSQNRLSWHNKVDVPNCRLSLSPAGNWAVVLVPRGGDFELKIFDKNGKDLLAGVSPSEKWRWQHGFYDAKASGEGIFYVYYDGTVHFGVLGKKGKVKKYELSQNTQTNLEKQGSTKKPKIEVSHKVVSRLGKLWEVVKEFFKNIFSFIFR